jgi:hypothetical protein
MKALISLILLLVLIVPTTLKSQQLTSPDLLLNRLTGKWILNGTIDGQKTIHDIDAQIILLPFVRTEKLKKVVV